MSDVELVIESKAKDLGGFQVRRVVLSLGTFPKLHAHEASRVLILGGVPLPEARHIWWNFVSSSKERIEKAKLDWKNQAFGSIKDEVEFIPLPES